MVVVLVFSPSARHKHTHARATGCAAVNAQLSQSNRARRNGGELFDIIIQRVEAAEASGQVATPYSEASYRP